MVDIMSTYDIENMALSLVLISPEGYSDKIFCKLVTYMIRKSCFFLR